MEEINEKLHMQLLDFDNGKRKEWVENRQPFSVLFELTPRCNFNCIHCYLQNCHVENQLTFEEIIEIIDILHDKGILFLTFTGGEILTRPDFVDIYVYAKKKGFLVELFTNGALFNEEILNVLHEYPPLLVDISLYGADEETYCKITGIRNAFEKVINNCKRLKELGIRVSLKSPIIKPTLPFIGKMKSLAEELQIPFVYSFEICATVDKSNEPQRLQVSLEEVLKNEFANYYEQVAYGTRKKEDNSEVIKSLADSKFVYDCNVAQNSFVVDYQGRMLPCMKLRHKGERLSKDNYDALWEKYKAYSELIASDTYKCKGCTARYYCDVCPAEMDFLYGDMEYRPQSVCKCATIRKAFYEGQKTFEEALQEAAFNE